MPQRKPIAIDLFAGCGGVTQGLKKAGFRVIAAVEIDELAARTYKLNHPNVSLMPGDIREVKSKAWMRELGLAKGELDLLVGCPPCQGFSTLRTRNGAHWNRDARNNLVGEMLRLVRELRPKAVMMENVPRLREKRVFQNFASDLKRLGYNVNWEVVNVQHYGVPQRRRRLVLIGGRDFQIPFPKRARAIRTVKQAIGTLKPAGKSGDALHDLPETRTQEVLDRIRAVPRNGGSRLDLPDEMQLDCHRRCDGFKDIYGRMAWDEVAPTITGGCFNPSKGRFLHPSKNRNITMREAALLQTFPKRYRFDLKAGKQGVALMIGNALPPELVRRQGAVIRRALLAFGKGTPNDKTGNPNKAFGRAERATT